MAAAIIIVYGLRASVIVAAIQALTPDELAAGWPW
jgi:hypothetical protein